tara:strand:- start:274 stop:447 length:174 start_codon:yes stop_codon:yes gene_type:complete
VTNIKELEKVVSQDETMIKELRELADIYKRYDVYRIANRLEHLTNKAHTRLHWTGNE